LRELYHRALVALRLRVAEAAQEIVAADAQQQEARSMLVERRRQTLERLRAHLARHSGAHHAPADELLELRRVALLLEGAGAVGEAVAEGEDHRVGGEARKFRRRRPA